MRRLLILGVCGLVGALFLGGPGVAQADLSKCSAAIQKEVGKLQKDMLLRLQKCDAFVEKEKAKGVKGSIAKAAGLCEKMIDKTIGVATEGELTATGKDKLSKFFAGIDKAKTKCSNAAPSKDLEDLGFLIGGVNAPGADAYDFLKNFLAANAIKNSYELMNQSSQRFMENVQDAIDKDKDKADGAKTFATCCKSGVGACESNEVYRPSLCAFDHNMGDPLTNAEDLATGSFHSQCRTHACKLTGSNSGVILADSALGGPVIGTNMLGICRMENNPRLSMDDFFLLTGGASHNILRSEVAGNLWVCVMTYRTAGFCDCAAGGSGIQAKSVNFCHEHFVDPNGSGQDACGVDIVKSEILANQELCYCGTSAGLNASGLTKIPVVTPFKSCFKDTDCGGTDLCITSEGGGRCWTGSYEGELRQTWGGGTIEGDCAAVTLTTLSAVDPTVLGGELGPDLTICTEDDTPQTGNPFRIPLVTGTATADCLNCLGDSWILTATCDPGAGTGRSGGPCVENSNCDNAGGDGVCDTTGAVLSDINAGPVLGSGIACNDFESSDLSGLELVGGIPVVDGDGLGDLAFTFNFKCE